MIVYRMGRYIMLGRRRLGLTQEEFAGRICAPLTLSRIENGHQSPGKGLLEKLLGLIREADRATGLLAAEGPREDSLRQKFEWNLIRRRYGSAEEALKLIEEREEKSVGSYADLARAVIDHKLGRTSHEAYLEKLREYFDGELAGEASFTEEYSIPGLEDLPCRGLDHAELYLLVELAKELSELGRTSEALLVLDAVDEADSTDFAQGGRALCVRVEAMLLRAGLMLEGREAKAACDLCDKLLEICADVLFFVPEILLIKARTLAKLRRGTERLGDLSERAYYMALDQWGSESAGRLREEFGRIVAS
ncbi:MAG: helix-turn-helix domain-containing protein [Lachnospiraceae bacterium]|nr:helix-turn-helix domain-containing protein [Lachnospiraceae bacterium]